MSNYHFFRSPNGCVLVFQDSVWNKKQKSLDVMFNNGQDNCYYKIGIIRDKDLLKKFFEFKE